MKSGTDQSIKFRLLSMRLKRPKFQIVGILESLWQITMSNAPLGNIGKFDNKSIAAGIEWDGDADELVDALVEEKWLDRSEEHRLIVHDWHEHAPDFIKKRLARSGQEFVTVDPANIAKNKIYVIQGDNCCKIGVSVNPTMRMETLSRETKMALSLVFVTEVPGNVVYKIERRCHDALSRYRINGEWFETTSDHCISIVNGVVSESLDPTRRNTSECVRRITPGSDGWREIPNKPNRTEPRPVPNQDIKAPSAPSFRTPPPEEEVEEGFFDSKEEIREEPASPPVLTFTCNGTPKTWDLTEAKVAEYQEAFPNLDIVGEARHALQWTRDNNAKTAKGMGKFLTGWFGRANDKLKSTGNGGGYRSREIPVDPTIDRSCLGF